MAILMGIGLICILSSCAGRSTEQISHGGASDTSVGVSSEVEAYPEKFDLKDQVKAQMEGYYPESAIQEIIVGEHKVEATVLDDCAADEETPENWQEVLDTATQSSTALQGLLGNYEIPYAVIHLKGGDGMILATAINGKISYNIYQSGESAVTNSSTISLAEYEMIEVGMTYEQVVALIGGPGRADVEMDMGVVGNYVSYTWDGDNGPYSWAIIGFRDNIVTSKMQVGL